MKDRKILVLDTPNSSWFEFLEEFFEDTPTTLCQAKSASDLDQTFKKQLPHLAFVNTDLLTLSITQKLKSIKQSNSEFRLFGIGPEKTDLDKTTLDGNFPSPDSLENFQKEIVSKLPMPDVIKVLIVDDEPDIGGALRDYLDGRSNPSFDVEYVDNGKKGMEAIQKRKPDVLVLDVKMPVMTGLEVYREIRKRELDIAVIVFFDAITGNEITELHKWGRPSIVDKGAERSAMPQMISLIKKMFYFA